MISQRICWEFQIEKIEKHFDTLTATKLIFSRNLIVKNSPMMIMIQRMYQAREDKEKKYLPMKEKQKLITIWIKCVSDEKLEVEKICKQNAFSNLIRKGLEHLKS